MRYAILSKASAIPLGFMECTVRPTLDEAAEFLVGEMGFDNLEQMIDLNMELMSWIKISAVH